MSVTVAIISAASAGLLWIPIPAWNSPLLTFSPFSVIPRVAAPTMHPCADRGIASLAPFLAAITAWQWLCCFSGTS